MHEIALDLLILLGGIWLVAITLRPIGLPTVMGELIVGLVRHHLICYSGEWTDAAVRRFIKRVGPDQVEPLLRLGEADALGKGRNVDEELAALQELRRRIDEQIEQGGALTTQDLAIDGKDVIEHLEGGAGPVVGQILRELLEQVIEDPSPVGTPSSGFGSFSACSVFLRRLALRARTVLRRS